MTSQTFARLREMHLQMLDWQRANAPWTPTVQELTDLWGYTSKNTASKILEQMCELGWILERRRYRGGLAFRQYYALEAKHETKTRSRA